VFQHEYETGIIQVEDRMMTFMYLSKYQKGVNRIKLFNILPPTIKSLNNDTNAFIPALKPVFITPLN
jgi:hypothetical protein